MLSRCPSVLMIVVSLVRCGALIAPCMLLLFVVLVVLFVVFAAFAFFIISGCCPLLVVRCVFGAFVFR